MCLKKTVQLILVCSYYFMTLWQLCQGSAIPQTHYCRKVCHLESVLVWSFLRHKALLSSYPCCFLFIHVQPNPKNQARKE
jgi:hypothetical protein